MPWRLNGKMDEATLEAIKAAPEHEQMEFLLTCAFETRRAVKNLPELIDAAITEHETKYHPEDKERKWWLVDTLGTRLSTLFWFALGAVLVTILNFIIWGHP